MTKPLFRWTVGGISSLGLQVLRESIRRIRRLFGSEMDYLICCNETDPYLKNQIEKLGVDLHYPSWEDFPLDPQIVPRTYDIEESPGTPIGGRQGSFWKMCPPRLRPHGHEIVVDNDVVIQKKFPELIRFLSDNKTLLVQEDAHSVGKYYLFFDQEEVFNSGFYGLPPDFDLADRLRCSWEETGKMRPLLSRDEQGIITYTLKQHNHIVINRDQMIHLMPEGRITKVEYAFTDENGHKARIIKRSEFTPTLPANAYGYHFLNINRLEKHKMWDQYCHRSIAL